MTVDDLRAQLVELTRARMRAIEEINRNYDREAIAIQREIEKLEPVTNCRHCGYKYGHRIGCPMFQAPATVHKPPRGKRPRGRQVKLGGTEDWTPDEIQHYKELLEKTR